MHCGEGPTATACSSCPLRHSLRFRLLQAKAPVDMAKIGPVTIRFTAAKRQRFERLGVFEKDRQLLRKLPALVKDSGNYHRLACYAVHDREREPPQHEFTMPGLTPAFAHRRACLEEQRFAYDFADDIVCRGLIVHRDERLDFKQVSRRAARPLKNEFSLTFGHARPAASISPRAPARLSGFGRPQCPHRRPQ